MASLIHELENNEALLLMYLSGELPAEDQMEVEQMLSGDSGLRRELAEIQSEYDSAIGVLAKLDADRSAMSAENHAVRQAMRAMKQWQVDRLARQPLIIAPPPKRIPVWTYPVASAAALLIGTIAWWGIGGQFHNPNNQNGTVAVNGTESTTDTTPASPESGPPPVPSQPEAMAPDGANPLPGPDQTGQLAPPQTALGQPVVAQSSDELTADRLDHSLAAESPSEDSATADTATRFTDAETQARSLIARSDNSSMNSEVSSEIFLTEANP